MLKLKNIKISGYKIALLFNMFPSYSLSVWFSSVFVQPRLFSFPFLLAKGLTFKLNRWNLLLGVNIFITIFTPLAGFFFGRQFNFLDIAYVLSATYAFLFINNTIKNPGTINLFNKFLRLTLILNICYAMLQICLYYVGLPQFTMIHSNIPFHVNSGYMIEPGVFLNIPRYTGLFIESGPLTFFLCLTFLYLIQNNFTFSKKLKLAILVMILLSQSKFLFVFLPSILVETFFIKNIPSLYRRVTTPGFFFSFLAIGSFLLITAIFTDFEFSEYLSATVPAYQLRLDGIRASLTALVNIEPFGKGLLGSNFETADAKFELMGIDVFSVVFFGYGLVMGTFMILSYLLFPVFARLKYKFTFTIILIFGFLSSGSLLVPQYLFALAYSILSHYQNQPLKPNTAI